MQTFGRRTAARLVSALALASGLLLLLLVADRIATTRAIDSVMRGARSSSILVSSGFRRELEKFRLVPIVLADDREARDALLTHDPARLAALNRKLEALSTQTRAANVYLLDARGVTVAASNWRRPESFLGDDYSYRAYYRDAMRTGAAQQFALGQRSRQPGLYISKRLSHGGASLGVIVVKVDFSALEREWRETSQSTLVTDARGIILVSADPTWRFQTIRPLSTSARASARRSLDYGAVSLAQNPIYARRLVADTRRPEAGTISFVEALAPVGGGWQVHVLGPTASAVGNAKILARFTVAVAALLGLAAWLVWRHRRRIIAARIDAETNSRVASLRDQLVQANKLATLGQITAGVGHEINQPVAAIAAYAHNAQMFLERARVSEAAAAMEQILALTSRIGLITRELRGFARRSSRELGPVALEEVFAGVALLLRDRLQMLTASFITEGRNLRVRAERIRLEQVLMNLVQNALDAGARLITVLPELTGDRVRIIVSDDGPGLSREMREALFQPFRTSKKDGLGLGLVICQDIVADFGGTLEARSSTAGAVFVIELEAAR